MTDSADTQGLKLPQDHPLRAALNEEIHARPPEPLSVPCRISYLALYADEAAKAANSGPVADLCARFDVTPPEPGTNHFQGDFGAFRLKWEKHTEFVRYTFVVDGIAAEDDPFQEPAIAQVPADWVEALPGQVMVSAHAAVLQGTNVKIDDEDTAQRFFNGNPLIGAFVGGGQGTAVTDFQVHEDGFTRFLLWDHGMTARQCGRTVQRLFEIDTYRIMALLGLPEARALGPFLTESEQEVAKITQAMVSASEEEEPDLLDRLTRLQAEIESRHADTHFRLSASAAYYNLVQRRISDIREERLPSMAMFGTFTERRLAPAMTTCETMELRQNNLSRRVNRATQLLSTRVEVSRLKQNQELLASMDKRAKVQLRLQETVEGLSIAAVTYYVASLVSYLAKGLKDAGVGINPTVATAISIPIIILLAALAVRKVRKLFKLK